jgi:CubicO group peptidase (beta-lactamase class C family)
MHSLSSRIVRVCAATATLASASALAAQPAATPPRPAWAGTLDSVARAAIAASKTPGASLAVVVDGQLVYAQAYGLANVETQQPMTSDMLLRVGSVTKMFTGTMLAELAERGQLRMDQPIGEVIPTLAGRRVGTVTAQQLMTHNAGWIDNAVAYGRMGEGALGEVMREVGDTLFFTEAGRTFSYSNPSVSMAGYVGEVAGKQRFATLVETLVLRPAGMTRATFKPLEALTWPIAMGHQAGADGAPRVVRPMTENTAQWAAGFLFASAPDIARYTIVMMNDGMANGQQVISRGAVKRVTTGYVRHPGGSGLDSAMYGYGLVVGRSKGERVWTHGGAINGYNASVTMLPDRKAAVVVIVNGSGAAVAPIESRALALATGFTRATVTPARRAPTAADRAALVGRYAMGGVQIEIIEQAGALQLRQGTVAMPLELDGTDRLIVTTPTGGRQTFFVRIVDGRATYLYSGSRALARQGTP